MKPAPNTPTSIRRPHRRRRCRTRLPPRPGAGVPITPAIATCLYTAMLTDTGSFCYSATSAQTFAFAREMVLAGADPAAIAQQVYFSNPPSKMHLLGRALSNLQCEGPISWMHVSLADMAASGATGEDCEGLVNWALSIHGIEATAFFREISGSATGSACAARDASMSPASPRPSAVAAMLRQRPRHRRSLGSCPQASVLAALRRALELSRQQTPARPSDRAAQALCPSHSCPSKRVRNLPALPCRLCP